MGKRATRDAIMDQIRRMPLEDRDYIEAELLRDSYEAGRRSDDPEQTAALVRRANDAPPGPIADCLATRPSPGRVRRSQPCVHATSREAILDRSRCAERARAGATAGLLG